MYHHFCPTCETKIMISLVDPEKEFAGYISLRVRAFRNVDLEKVKVRNASIKDEDPMYDPDAIPKGECDVVMLCTGARICCVNVCRRTDL